MNGGDFKIGRMLAYQGKTDCVDPRCTRMIYSEPPHVRPGCMGWHCADCDEPCSSQGHRCSREGVA